MKVDPRLLSCFDTRPRLHEEIIGPRGLDFGFHVHDFYICTDGHDPEKRQKIDLG